MFWVFSLFGLRNSLNVVGNEEDSTFPEYLPQQSDDPQMILLRSDPSLNRMGGPDMSLLNTIREEREEIVGEVTRDGIDPDSRSFLWQNLSSGLLFQSRYPYLYDQLKQITLPNSLLEAISSDIKRTFSFSSSISESFTSSKEEELYNLLCAYAALEMPIRYAQGMNFLGGVLLLHLEEEEAFWVLASIMTEFGCEMFFAPQNDWTRVFDHIGKRLFPRLYEHLEKMELSAELYLTQWFRSFFLYSENYDLSVRTFDTFFVSGMEGLYRIGLGILGYFHDRLLEMEFMDAWKLLTQQVNEVSIDEVFKIAAKLPISTFHLAEQFAEEALSNPKYESNFGLPQE